MSINISDYKQVINKFLTGVTIITGHHKQKNIGITVNSFTSFSLDESLVLFNIDKSSSAHNDLYFANNYNINILSSQQKDLAQSFAQKNIDKFANIKLGQDYQIDKNNNAIFSKNLALISCKKDKIIDYTSHSIFICKVESFANDDSKSPLTYYNSIIK